MQSFNDFTLSAPILRAIQELGYEKPSPIQIQALPLLLEKSTDFIGLAATGTGKTAAFSIPMLEQIDPSSRSVQALILCPTRELAMQVAGQVNLLGKYKGVKAQAIYGGASYSQQISGLKGGANVVVGTPGRLVDHIERGTLKLDSIKLLILDEADEMISMGFKEDLEKILGSTQRESSQIWLFSATMSREVRKVADKYLKQPVHVQVNKTEVLPSTITQLYYIARESDKPEILCKMIDVADDFYGIVFCQTKSLVADLTNYLTERGYKVDCLHGDKDQKSRERTMQSFRDHRVKILVCTDVASRGLDVKDITHVINYSIPRELDSYVHRIGRTARSGKNGFAMSLLTPAQSRIIYRLEEMTKSRMQQGVIPTRKQVGSKKVSLVLPKFQTQKFSERAVELLDESWKTCLEGLSKEEIAGRFLAMMNPALFSMDMDERAQMPGPRPESRGYGEPQRGRRDRPGRGDRSHGFESRRSNRSESHRPERSVAFKSERSEGYRSERSERPFKAERGGDRPDYRQEPGDRRKERSERGDRGFDFKDRRREGSEDTKSNRKSVSSGISYGRDAKKSRKSQVHRFNPNFKKKS